VRLLKRCLVAWLGGLLLVGCGDDGGGERDLFVVIETADGQNPVAARPVDELSIRIRQGDGDVVELTEMTDGAFDLSTPIAELDAPTTIGVQLRGDDAVLQGAAPTFLPFEAGALVRVLVGVPGECERLATPTFARGLRGHAIARSGTFAVVIGGVSPDGPSSEVAFIDLLRGVVGERPALSGAPPAAAKAATLPGGEVLVLSAQRAPFAYDLTATSEPVRDVTLYPGAGLRSSLVAGDTLFVVGGEDGAGPVRGARSFRSDGSSHATELAVPRQDPAAARSSAGLLVAGGMASGEPLVELLPSDGSPSRVVLAAPDHGSREGAQLVADPAGGRFLLVGGLGSAGQPRADTLVLSGCADGCEATPGPEWENPRRAVHAISGPDGAWLVGGESGDGMASTRRDRVLFSPDSVTITPAEPLPQARGGAAVLSLEDTGETFLFGGRGPDGLRRDAAVCFPRMRPGP
jgi:hypothetical protein